VLHICIELQSLQFYSLLSSFLSLPPVVVVVVVVVLVVVVVGNLGRAPKR
jgi:low affinity Fe/Cu permease